MSDTYPDLIGRVTSITPRQPTWWERLLSFLAHPFGGPTMPDPTGLTATFTNQPVGGYPAGATMELEVTATADVLPETVTAEVTFYSKTAPTVAIGTATADATALLPDTLTSAVTDAAERDWTAGETSQDGTAYTALYTAPA